ncbi:MAG: hypothetical protein EBR23_15050, partial [Planctomycetia bacterium]|nr:hypothetical protein [Planctomycetia bacterium]
QERVRGGETLNQKQFIEKTQYLLLKEDLANKKEALGQMLEGIDGVYLIAFKERLAPVDPPFAQVKAKVTEDYRKNQATELTLQEGTKLVQAATEALAKGKTFKDAAKELGHVALEMPPFNRAARKLDIIEDRGLSVDEFRDQAFALTAGKVSKFQSTSSGGFVIYVKGFQPVAEEQVEDGDVGLLVLVSTADDRHRAPLDVKLPAAGARTLVRFHDAGSHLALFTSDPLEHPEARRLDFDRDYPVADLGFAADVFRRLYVESTAAGRDAVSVEIDVAGDGTWAPVDGLMITSQSTAADVVGGLPVESAPPQAQIQANQSFLLPAQGIGSEPGKVAITFGAATFDCSVEKWTSSALQARVAAVPLTAAA